MASHLQHSLTLDGAEYVWEQRHGWLVETGKGLKGVSVSVWLKPGKTRELVIDFSFSVFGLDKKPGRVKIAKALQQAIRSARQEGWDPESRGKTFRFLAPETA